MERPLFSDMLFDRRRQLGLSIKQASNVLRLKEEVLIAFEEGDFDSIPKSGYAQGMLSSYARYLGLNAKTVVNQFSQDLFEHERGAGSHEARRNRRRLSRDDDGPLYETPQAAAPGQGGSRRTYVESRGFLPTSGGFAGDMGDFATTSPARPRYRSQSSPDDTGESAYPQGRPYTSRVPHAAGMTPLGQVQRQRSRTSSDGYGASESYGAGSGLAGRSYGARDQVTTRRVMPSQYRDDMRLDNEGGGFQTASSVAGRRSSRNIANTQRPNVSRRMSRGAREQLGRRDRQQQDGIMGMLGSLFAERGGVVALIIAVLCILLTATILLSVRSCISSHQSTGRSVAVTSATSEDDTQEQDQSKSTITDEEEREARERAAAEKAAETQSAETERTIEVTVAEGEVTWLEVEYDGKSDIAETVTGPWDRTYTVRQSITINVGDTTAVTVTENGKKLEFDSKASGIGTITLQVSSSSDATSTTDTQNPTTSDQSQTPGVTDGMQNGTPTDPNGTGAQMQQDQQQGQQQQGQGQYQTTDQGTMQQTQDGMAQGTPTQGGSSPYEGYTLDSDGYYYGADGYYDAAGNFYQY